MTEVSTEYPAFAVREDNLKDPEKIYEEISNLVYELTQMRNQLADAINDLEARVTALEP